MNICGSPLPVFTNKATVYIFMQGILRVVTSYPRLRALGAEPDTWILRKVIYFRSALRRNLERREEAE